jgi:hypothetical protein
VGSAILVNLGHEACPRNRYSRSMYIWCCGFAELALWGAFGASEELNRDQLTGYA